MDLGDRAEHRNLEQSRVKYGETGLSHPGDRLQFANPRLDGFNVFFFLKKSLLIFLFGGGTIAAGLAEPLKYKQELMFFNASRREVSLAYRRPPADK